MKQRPNFDVPPPRPFYSAKATLRVIENGCAVISSMSSEVVVAVSDDMARKLRPLVGVVGGLRLTVEAEPKEDETKWLVFDAR